MTAPADPVLAYARSVLAGKTVAGRLVRQACQRHLDDLRDGPGRGLRWDLGAALHAIGFFDFLRLAEGEFDGKPFVLQPWQQFMVGSLFGWKQEDGYRRFRTAYVEVAKGNGKSPSAAGIGLYALVADGEASAEVYSAATTLKQAGILFRDARLMAEASPGLKKRLVVDRSNIAHPQSNSFFRPVSSEHKGLDGKRVHMALIDELHEHPDALVVDKLRAGTKGRRQALIFEITNSGHDRDTVCYRHREYSESVLAGRVSNDSWFALICGLDPCQRHLDEGQTQPVEGCEECDDWRDEKVWPKANPNLGVSITHRYLREQVKEAEGMPAKTGIVRRLNFGWWTTGAAPWLPAALWSRGGGPIDVAQLQGRPCYGGLDVASKVDVAAFVLAFPDCPGEGDVTLLPRFWIPREQAEIHQREGGAPYLDWERQGLVTITPGNTIDQDAIEAAIKADAETYCVAEVAFDPWNAAMLAGHLQQFGVQVVQFGQSMANFNEPTKLFEQLLKEGKLKHGDNAPLSWMAGNVAVITDRSGNVRPSKPAHGSARKVDGVIAAVMALARLMLAPKQDGPLVEVW